MLVHRKVAWTTPEFLPQLTCSRVIEKGSDIDLKRGFKTKINEVVVRHNFNT